MSKLIKKDHYTAQNKKLKVLALLTLSTFLGGCDSLGNVGIGSVEPDQAAIIFRRLPPFLGGGLSEDIVRPGEKRVLWPWESLYKVSTGIREITWNSEDNLRSRSRDGSTILLEIMVRYRVNVTPTTLQSLVQRGALDDKGIDNMVSTMVRSDIRLFMNKLSTEEFLKRAKVQKIQNELEESLTQRLKEYGIIIELFKLRDFHFDQKYQDLLDQIQASQEQREEAEQKKATSVAKKEKETRQAEGIVSKATMVAKGGLEMAIIRGTEYLEQKKNEAARIEAEGMAKVATMKAHLDAFSGPGGENMLKIEIVKGLVASKPNFVVMNQGSGDASGQSLNVQRVDTNQLLSQLGLLDAVSVKDKEQQQPQVKPPLSGIGGIPSVVVTPNTMP
jgi:regulator of protease activity HflC (stomatin/prohibitin superfamily)